MHQKYEQYTAEHQEVWQLLFARQAANLTDKVSPAYLDSLYAMSDVLNDESIPLIEKLNEALYRRNGWRIIVVPGLIPAGEFLSLLAQRTFCSSTWVRQRHQLDYLEEPDMFHDIFGHVPLLWDPGYARFMQEVGQLGVKYAGNPEAVAMLERFYWFTIEFGLAGRPGERPQIYGAGIISSFGETNSIFTSRPVIEPFNLREVLFHPFEKDHIQNQYYRINSLEELYGSLPEVDALLRAEQQSEREVRELYRSSQSSVAVSTEV